MEKKELEKFLYYILDKVEDCYRKEVERAISDFLKETAPEMPVQEQPNGMIAPIINNTEWISELAKKIATCLATHDTPSKE